MGGRGSKGKKVPAAGAAAGEATATAAPAPAAAAAAPAQRPVAEKHEMEAANAARQIQVDLADRMDGIGGMRDRAARVEAGKKVVAEGQALARRAATAARASRAAATKDPTPANERSAANAERLAAGAASGVKNLRGSLAQWR